MCSSGYLSRDVAPVRRDQARQVGRQVVIARIPSNFGSNHHVGSSNAFHPPSASIGCIAGGESIERRLLVRGEEREPVGPGLHEVVLEAGVPAAVEPEAHLLLGPLDRLVPAVVEDPDLAGAVVALGDRALERAVLERVVLGADREPLVLRAASGARAAPPTTAARRPARAGRRSGAGSPGACGSRTSSPRLGAARRRLGGPLGSERALAQVLVELRVLRGGDHLLGRAPARASDVRRSSSRGSPTASSAGARSCGSVRTPSNRSPSLAKRSHTLSIRKSCGVTPRLDLVPR